MTYTERYQCGSLTMAVSKTRDAAMRLADFCMVVDLQPELTPGEVRTAISTKNSILQDLRGYAAEAERQMYIRCRIDYGNQSPAGEDANPCLPEEA